MLRQTLYLWKQTPFLRLVIPLIAGIITGWYIRLPVQLAWISFITGIGGLFVFNLRISFLHYKFSWVNGNFVNILFLSIGLLTVYYKDVSHQQQWMNRYYHDKDIVTVTLEEPLAEKATAYKANASVQQLVHENMARSV